MSWTPVAYAASNLPSAYLDTRLLDDPEEVAFTVGSAKANTIRVGVSYYTYIRTNNGDASQDNGKLQGQLGHRFPKSCYGSGCSFGDQPPVTIVPAWQVPVPGTLNWPFGGPTGYSKGLRIEGWYMLRADIPKSVTVIEHYDEGGVVCALGNL